MPRARKEPEAQADSLEVQEDLQLQDDDSIFAAVIAEEKSIPPFDAQAWVQHLVDVINALEQRVEDLETLVGQPDGAVAFQALGVPNQHPPVPGVPWYQPLQ